MKINYRLNYWRQSCAFARRKKGKERYRQGIPSGGLWQRQWGLTGAGQTFKFRQTFAQVAHPTNSTLIPLERNPLVLISFNAVEFFPPNHESRFASKVFVPVQTTLSRFTWTLQKNGCKGLSEGLCHGTLR